MEARGSSETSVFFTVISDLGDSLLLRLSYPIMSSYNSRNKTQTLTGDLAAFQTLACLPYPLHSVSAVPHKPTLAKYRLVVYLTRNVCPKNVLRFEKSDHHRYDVLSPGIWLPTFRRMVLPLSPRVFTVFKCTVWGGVHVGKTQEVKFPFFWVITRRKLI